MKTRITACLTTLACALSLGVAAATAPDLSGTWTMTVKGQGAHGDMTASLVLKQEAQAVTGTMTAHGGEHAVSGEFVDGSLTLTVGSESQDHHRTTLTAKLKDDGTLAGYLSGPQGDMQWTAVRAKAK
jgi:polyisoprenoid-binding protein YceI